MSEESDRIEMLIYSDVTVGRLLRRLNADCVAALHRGDENHSKIAARLSRAVEDAVLFSGLDKEIMSE